MRCGWCSCVGCLANTCWSGFIIARICHHLNTSQFPYLHRESLIRAANTLNLHVLDCFTIPESLGLAKIFLYLRTGNQLSTTHPLLRTDADVVQFLQLWKVVNHSLSVPATQKLRSLIKSSYKWSGQSQLSISRRYQSQAKGNNCFGVGPHTTTTTHTITFLGCFLY